MSDKPTRPPAPKPEEIRQLQNDEGLSDNQMRELFGYSDTRMIRNIKTPAGLNSHRQMSGPAVRLFDLLKGKTTLKKLLKDVKKSS